MVKKYAVFGAGFIGLSLARLLLNNNQKVVVLDRNDCPDEFNGSVLWHKGEFKDLEKIHEALEGVDYAYNFFSNTAPLRGLSKAHNDSEVSNNISFLEACVKKNLKKVIFASSASVYGHQEFSPIPESATTNPISSHGITKLTIEKYHLMANYLHDLPICVARISNPYGPRQSMSAGRGFVSILAHQILNNQPIKLVEGEVVRDFIYIDDLVSNLHEIFGVNNSKHNTIGYINDICSEDMRWELQQQMKQSLENPKNDLSD
jgi:UDP-glucose 4-epimerase